jgi:hypothetical protein
MDWVRQVMSPLRRGILEGINWWAWRVKSEPGKQASYFRPLSGHLRLSRRLRALHHVNKAMGSGVFNDESDPRVGQFMHEKRETARIQLLDAKSSDLLFKNLTSYLMCHVHPRELAKDNRHDLRDVSNRFHGGEGLHLLNLICQTSVACRKLSIP